MIEKYVRAYRDAFTLRRAPFLLSYAVYSAVTVILTQERNGHGGLKESISFFWTCLNELQRGCNFGLKKPMGILQEMVRGLQVGVNEGSLADPESQLQPSLGESLLFRLPASQDTSMMTPQTSGSTSGQGAMGQTPDYYSNTMDPNGETIPGDMLNFLNDQSFLNDQEIDIYQDSLYGLFAPSPHLHLP